MIWKRDHIICPIVAPKCELTTWKWAYFAYLLCVSKIFLLFGGNRSKNTEKVSFDQRMGPLWTVCRAGIGWSKYTKSIQLCKLLLYLWQICAKLFNILQTKVSHLKLLLNCCCLSCKTGLHAQISNLFQISEVSVHSLQRTLVRFLRVHLHIHFVWHLREKI